MKYSQKSLIGKVYQTTLDHNLIKSGDRVVVALSGGPDSIALLNILLSLREKLAIEVAACHYNHRLRGEASDQDELFVKDICAKLGIDCYVGSAKTAHELKSEDLARRARYSFFEKILEEGRGDSIAIAHNLNDQAETVLMRVIRGAGIRGLKSIPYKRNFFIRPLLDVSRNEIEQYLTNEGIAYVIDQTNFSPDYFRNQIRSKLLPYLAKANPQILKVLSNLSKSTSLDYDYIEVMASSELDRIRQKGSDEEYIFDRLKWLELHPALRAMTIRLALEKLDSIDDISSAHLTEVIHLLEKGVGKKYKQLPRSLIITLVDGKIVIKKY